MITTNKNFSCIYIIISPSNKIYIGRTVSFRKRENSYKRMDCKEQKKLFRSLKKYGTESHKIDVLLKCSPNELNFWEAFYIKLFNSFDSKDGLNLTSGGDGVTHTEETKYKISLGNRGKVVSMETRNKLSIAAKEKHKNYTDEQRIEISLKNHYKTEEGKQQLLKSSIRQRNNNKSVKVNQYSLDGHFIKEWDSICEIRRQLGIETSHISNCINDKRKYSHGFVWKKAI